MTTRFGLEGRFGLVAGAASVGEACVARLRDEGMTIAFAGTDTGRGKSIASRTGATFLEYESVSRASSDRAVEQALELGNGHLDVLVTGAGKWLRGSIEATSEDEFRDVLEADLTAPFRVARAGMAAMRGNGGGSIIHVASDAGLRADHEMAAYSVAAAGVIAAAELFAAEGAPHGVRANAVCPSHDMSPDEVAAVVAWLASDESAHVSGATLRIDASTGAAMVIDTRT